MTRNLTSAVAGAVQGEQVARTVAVALDFPSGIARFNSSPTDITFGGATYLGVGILGSVSVTEESAELRAYGLTITLSGIPRDAFALALLQGYQGRRGSVWEVPLNPTTFAVLANPVLIFRGRMDTMQIGLGANAAVTVALENRLTDWDRPRMSRYTDEDQQAAQPGDTGFRFVSAMAEREIIWPGRAALESAAKNR